MTKMETKYFELLTSPAPLVFTAQDIQRGRGEFFIKMPAKESITSEKDVALTKQVKCGWCGKLFWGRQDSKWCNEQCRYKNRALEAKITLAKIPKSGVQGITFSRIRRRWEARIKEGPGDWKYIGSFKTALEAVKFQVEVTDELPRRMRVSRRKNGKTNEAGIDQD